MKALARPGSLGYVKALAMPGSLIEPPFFSTSLVCCLVIAFVVCSPVQPQSTDVTITASPNLQAMLIFARKCLNIKLAYPNLLILLSWTICHCSYVQVQPQSTKNSKRSQSPTHADHVSCVIKVSMCKCSLRARTFEPQPVANPSSPCHICSLCLCMGEGKEGKASKARPSSKASAAVVM